ncbi:hypothetical protein KGP36_05155 [Patescibacteria group bacterium]|nr:hypothetical protein [Patescibacteria group bacterium]MDE1940660.1 hypothetical protein [Patescibacteria group bacterium]
MEQEIEKIKGELAAHRELLEKIYVSAEKTRKYYLWTMWGTVIVFVLPLIALAFVIPYYMNEFNNAFSGMGVSPMTGLGL